MENFTEFDTLETTPQQDRSAIISHAFEKYKKVIWYGVLIIVGGGIASNLISGLLGSLIGYDQAAAMSVIKEAIETKNYQLLNDVSGLKGSYGVSFLISLLFFPLYAGFMYVLNKANFNEEISFQDLFIGYKQNTLQLILYYFISTVAIFIAFTLCILPGLFIAPLFFLGLPIVFFENATATDALKKSFEIVKKNYWSFFGLAIITFLISFSGIVVCCVGIIFTAMFSYAAKYSAYCAYLGAPKPITKA